MTNMTSCQCSICTSEDCSDFERMGETIKPDIYMGPDAEDWLKYLKERKENEKS